MNRSFLTDEHVPSVFITTLRSTGSDVVTVRSVLEPGTDDRAVLQYAPDHEHVVITNDRSDFTDIGATDEHIGIVIYTDRAALVNSPEASVQTLERALSFYSPSDLEDQIIWLDEWR